MSTSFSKPSIWQLDRVRASALPHDLVPAARVSLGLSIHAWLLTIFYVHRLLFAKMALPFSASRLEENAVFVTTVEKCEFFHCIRQSKLPSCLANDKTPSCASD